MKNSGALKKGRCSNRRAWYTGRDQDIAFRTFGGDLLLQMSKLSLA